MLLSIPVELQADVLKLLSARDLSSVVRVSRHLHAVGFRFLYELVDLRTIDHVRAFFCLIRPGHRESIATTKRNKDKRAQWEHIKTLVITTAGLGLKRSLGTLPQSLSERGVGPLQLDRLRLTYGDNADHLLPLLRRLRPTVLELCRTSAAYGSPNDQWLSSIPSWANVTHVTFGCLGKRLPSRLHAHTDGLGPAFPRATSAKLLLPREDWSEAIWSYTYLSEAIVLLCPNLDGVEICLSDGGPAASVADTVKQDTSSPRGLAGKPASFWSVVLKPQRSNFWDDVNDRYASGSR